MRENSFLSIFFSSYLLQLFSFVTPKKVAIEMIVKCCFHMGDLSKCKFSWRCYFEPIYLCSSFTIGVSSLQMFNGTFCVLGCVSLDI